jgi:thiol-disulfide isomerase/thioredoxin
LQISGKGFCAPNITRLPPPPCSFRVATASIRDNCPVAWVKMIPRDEVEQHHNRSRWRRLTPTLAIAGALLAVVLYGFLRPAPEENRSRAVAFDLPLLSGDGSLATGDLEGHVVVLNFWASWCAPCRREMPMFERVWRDYRGRNVTIVGVDVRDIPTDARSFVEKYDITYPIVRDEDEVLVDRLSADPLPQTFFIAADGRLDGDQILGEASEEQLRARLDDLLESET